MHEMSMVSAVLETLTELSEKNRWRKIRSVTLNVGAMRQVVPQAMTFAFDVSKADTPAKDAELIIRQIPVEFTCCGCKNRWGEEHMGYLCPYCGGKDTDMVHGLELDIDCLEVDE